MASKTNPTYEAGRQWQKLAESFTQLLNGNESQSFEETYRTAYNLVLSKHDRFLYENMSILLKEHLDNEVHNRLVPKIPADILDPELMKTFLNALLDLWTSFCESLDKILACLRYLERVYCIPQKLAGIKEVGLRLFISQVLRAQILDECPKRILQSQIEEVATGMTIDLELLKSYLDMLLYLEQTVPGEDIFRTTFLLPLLSHSAKDNVLIHQYLTDNGQEDIQLSVIRNSLQNKESPLVKGLPQPILEILMSILSVEEPTSVEN